MERLARTDPESDRVSAEGDLEMGLAAGGWLRYGVADLGAVVEEARERRDLSPIAAAAFGRSLTAAALLLRLAEKTPSRLVLEIRGSGPLRTIRAEADAEGRVRGMVGNPLVDLPHGPGGKLAVGSAVGSGTLRVVREHRRGSYASEVELVSGEIGVDVAHYLDQSEQTRSAVLLGVLTRPHGVVGAGGMIVEVLPGAPEEVVAALESNVGGMAGVSRLLEEGGREHVTDTVLSGMDREILERRALHHRCGCSRERLLRHLVMVSDEHLDEMTTPQGMVEGECVFCGAVYVFEPEELRAQGEDSTNEGPCV